MTTLFVSDLHIDAARPEIAAQFAKFLGDEAQSADALYILGDLFESWIGDDDPNPHYAQTKQRLRALVDYGVPVFFMHGNRDFMIGERFANETGVVILDDPLVRNIHGRDVLLGHGDAYCTDDHEYQAARRMTRDPKWQSMMLARPLHDRMAFAAAARTKSAARSGTLDTRITDVNPQAIDAVMQQHGVQIMLHGHTHRPAIHLIQRHDCAATRIVLGDWFEHGSVVRWDSLGPMLSAIPRPD